MYLPAFMLQVMIWFVPAYLLGVGGFWMSFAETLPAAQPLGDAC